MLAPRNAIEDAGPEVIQRVAEKGADRRKMVRAAKVLGTVPVDQPTLDALAQDARGPDPFVGLSAARTLVPHKDERGHEALLNLRSVQQSAKLDTDDEDESLAAGLSTGVLKVAWLENPRRQGESWDR